MRWQKKRWSSNSTLRSTDNSGILQCFRGTTVCAASGGLDMHVPEPFLQGKKRKKLLYRNLLQRGITGERHTQVTDERKLLHDSLLSQCVFSSSVSERHSPRARSHPCDRGAGRVVAIADRARLAAEWRPAVRGAVRPSPSTSHRRHTHGSLLPAVSLVLWSLSLFLHLCPARDQVRHTVIEQGCSGLSNT